MLGEFTVSQGVRVLLQGPLSEDLKLVALRDTNGRVKSVSPEHDSSIACYVHHHYHHHYPRQQDLHGALKGISPPSVSMPVSIRRGDIRDEMVKLYC
ncbi:hypothetical protein E2C01_060941 [Portunus trituberculatus]|uniref:Uncharacterized protein n=1 Tax=Portunus trituberculatus TaxID=210409 RepID=A0A5B7HD10_PORTR|nr:hypothetical protein [Portunus trituberculatus]